VLCRTGRPWSSSDEPAAQHALAADSVPLAAASQVRYSCARGTARLNRRAVGRADGVATLMNVTPSEPDRLPVVLRIVLAASFAGSAALVCRLVWEQTFLTWRLGPQMVGFSLAHAELGLFMVLLASVLVFAISYAIALVWSIVAILRGRRVLKRRWSMLVLSATFVALLFVPYSMWQYAFAGRLATGPHAQSFFVYAAATGDLRTVEQLLSRGLPVNARNEDGSTALYGAAVEGQMPVIRYLVEHGADVNIKNNFASTALGAAREMNRAEAIRYLENHGAK
jgi:hypothetical protein